MPPCMTPSLCRLYVSRFVDLCVRNICARHSLVDSHLFSLGVVRHVFVLVALRVFLSVCTGQSSTCIYGIIYVNFVALLTPLQVPLRDNIY